MATLTVGTIADTGTTLTLGAAAAGGDEFPNPADEATMLVIANASGGTVTVTITVQQATFAVPGRGSATKSNGGGNISTGTTRLFGPFPAETYNNTSGRVAISYSSTTSVTVQALRMPRSM